MARKPRRKSARSKKSTTSKAPPIAKPKPVERFIHGERLIDVYAWLRAANWREVMRDPSVLEPEIRDYLEAENRYSEKSFKKTAKLKKTLITEMRGRIKEDDSTVPARDGSYAYFVSYREGGQHPLMYRVPGEGGDALAKGKAYFHLGEARHSPDHRLLAWSADDAGSELNTIHIRDLASGKDLSDLVPDSTGAVLWIADSRGFFYVRLDAEHRPSRVFFHRIGTTAESDPLIYKEEDKGFFVSVDRLQAGTYGAVGCGDQDRTSDVYG